VPTDYRMFIYAKDRRLALEISAALQADDCLICSDPNDLAIHLNRPDQNFSTGILALETRAELVELAGLRELLNRIHLVVVLEEDNQRTVTLAHQLESRYLGLRAQSPAEVKSTINHITSRLRSELGKQGEGSPSPPGPGGPPKKTGT